MGGMSGRGHRRMTVSIESEEYLSGDAVIAGAAVYTDPISGELRGFWGKDEAEAVQWARLAVQRFLDAGGLDPMPEVE